MTDTTITMSTVTVKLDAASSNFLAYTADDDHHAVLREVIARLIEQGELKNAGYDIGACGGLAFKQGELTDREPFCQVENLADLCEPLASYLQEACEQQLAA